MGMWLAVLPRCWYGHVAGCVASAGNLYSFFFCTLNEGGGGGGDCDWVQFKLDTGITSLILQSFLDGPNVHMRQALACILHHHLC